MDLRTFLEGRFRQDSMCSEQDIQHRGGTDARAAVKFARFVVEALAGPLLSVMLEELAVVGDHG